MITKRQVILTQQVPPWPGSNAVSFHCEEEPFTCGLHLLGGDWEEMGSPTTITVTIEPGDKLNGENRRSDS